MRTLAGTSEGVFALEAGAAHPVLPCRGVRELLASGERCYAGTGDGLFASDDAGQSWSLAGIEGREVWQIRSAVDGTLYAGTQPPAVFRSQDAGRSWHELESFAASAHAERWCLPLDPPQPGPIK